MLDFSVRNHNYADVLLLAHRSNSISRCFPSNPLVQCVKAECDARVEAMLGQLLRMHSEQAKLRPLFCVVGFLHKMDIPFKTIEIAKKAAESTRRRREISKENLLSLLRGPPHIPDPSLPTSLLTQLVYCANSFARVGVDLRALLALIFIDAVWSGVVPKRKLRRPLNAGLKGWVMQGERYERVSSQLSNICCQTFSVFVASTSLASPPLPTKAKLNTVISGPPDDHPPTLVSYPALAQSAKMHSYRPQQPPYACSRRSARRPLSAAEQYLNGGGEEEQKHLEVVRAAGTAYVEVFVPFLRRALVEVYGVVMKDKEIPMEKELRVTLER
ncbi:uncharacterized protein LAESUDRAFT_762976 [Laetiporus sulphureus 93-53]|uniref:Conserved oligomeric Golgi complex subunit 8 n=1 Tax=Laetiporus sulphureus 93-53 TaxID=1314785 RepID=A0A165C4Z8_9APHY|nr:uncharacterized protein LAESUDRAFT_762976 [Laetiporus sulphureus 93-53]KZT02214.1 hypothetical protein LAESUDRAFT_762976 [Laetiporus sulphureus 93-53]